MGQSRNDGISVGAPHFVNRNLWEWYTQSQVAFVLCGAFCFPPRSEKLPLSAVNL
jgi:hypothetical protein